MKLNFRFPGKLLPFGEVTINKKPDADRAQNDLISDYLKQTKSGIYIAIFYALLMLIILLACPPPTKAQETEHNGLSIGDKVPDVTIRNILNYKSASAKVSDFKGKLLIIDFWATWCSPCIYMIPRMDSLQKAFLGDLQFLSVSDQSQNTVVTFVERLKKQHPFNLVEVYGDTTLNRMFPHNSLPHYVWIDKEGRVAAITGHDAVNASRIKKALNGNNTGFTVKNDVIIDYNPLKPLFNISNPSDKQDVNTYSILTGYKAGVGCGHYNDINLKTVDNNYRRVTSFNLTVAQLYQIAMSKGRRTFDWNETSLQVRDTTMLNTSLGGEPFLKWLDDNRGYCYELIIPKADTGQAYERMQKDLEFYFPQYKARIEKKSMACLALVRTGQTPIDVSAKEKPEANFDVTGGTMVNCNLNVFVSRLRIFQQGSGLILKNETGYKAYVDLDINADMRDIGQVNDELEKYNLKFVRKSEDVDMLVITDSPKNTSALQ